MTIIDSAILQRIDNKLIQLNKLRPLPSSAVKKIQQQLQIEMTYNSNAIEGNTLTLKETYLVINEGITIKGKSLKDHLETKDHHEALEFLYELVKSDTKPTISEQLIQQIHHLVVKKTDEEWAGKYRNSNVMIGGADHTPIDASQVSVEMRELMKWFSHSQKKLHPIELAAMIHHKLVYIHPFFDGNGRTARLTSNIILMRHGYPLAIVLKNDRQKYYRYLAKADADKHRQFVKLIAQSVERSLDIYLKTLTPATQIREEFLSLADISKQTEYSEKYLNLLINKGKLAGHKQGRNWVTTLEAVERYRKNRERER